MRCGTVPIRSTANPCMTDLDLQFDELADNLTQLIALLQEADDRFWVAYLRRGLADVRRRRLAGATFVLGCYGGEATFSDLVIGRHFEANEPQRFRNLNARLGHLRTRTFEAANAITARRSW
jgi:hypothetical protein